MKTRLNLDTDFWCPDLEVETYSTAKIERSAKSVDFKVLCDYFKLDHQFFIGLAGNETPDGEPESVIGVLIDPENGEVVDLLNGQGVIGYLSTAPLQPWSRPVLGIEVERINSVLIPHIVIGEERILHPALKRIEIGDISGLAGSTACFLGSRARFLGPELKVS